MQELIEAHDEALCAYNECVTLEKALEELMLYCDILKISEAAIIKNRQMLISLGKFLKNKADQIAKRELPDNFGFCQEPQKESE